MPTAPRWTTESYDPADPDNYPDHAEKPDVDDQGDDAESHGASTESARAPEDFATEGDDDEIDVGDTQTGQGGRVVAHQSFGTGWPECQPNNMVVLVRNDGFRRAFHRHVVDLMQVCLDVTEALGYDVEPWQSWGYSCRPVAGTRTASNHSWGTAVDVNAVDNPRRRDRKFQSNLPGNVVRFWKAQGFRWGGNFSWPDPMHFEYMGTADQARRKAADLRAFFASLGGNTPPPALPAGGYMIPPTVRPGDTGKTVRKMQGLLVAHGGTQLEPLDGIYGPETEAVLRYFQGSGHDGICGPATWRRLIET